MVYFINKETHFKHSASIWFYLAVFCLKNKVKNADENIIS